MKIWDNVTLITNWLIGLSLLLAFITLPVASTEGGITASFHIIALSVLFSATFIRIIWAFIGTNASHITNMLRSPSKILVQIYTLISSNSTIRFIGHSPIGGICAAITLGIIMYASIIGLFFVAPDGTATPTAIFFEKFYVTERMASHNLMILASVISWSVYSFGVFVKLFLQGSTYSEFIFDGVENVNGYEGENSKFFQTRRYFTSGFATYALTAILFAVIVLPSMNTVSEYVDAESFNPANIATHFGHQDNDEKHFATRTPTDWATELADVQTAAGEETLPERLEREIYQLNNIDLTQYQSSEEVDYLADNATTDISPENIGFQNVRDLQNIMTAAGDEEGEITIERTENGNVLRYQENPQSGFMVPVPTTSE